MTEYIEPEQAIAVVEKLGLHIRDQGLLFSALARPSAGMFGEDAYPTLEAKAAALFSSSAQNHPLSDGNKRLSMYLTFAFLRINGFRVTFTNDQAFELVQRVAQNTITLEDLTETLRAHFIPA